MPEIIHRESKGSDSKFECVVDGKTSTVMLYLNTAIMSSNDSRDTYFGDDNKRGWGLLIKQEPTRETECLLDC